jgi:hypothetical protein
MNEQKNRKGQVAAGLGILAAVSVLCLKGMKKVDAKLKERKQKLKK